MQSVQSALLSVQAQAKLAQESNPKPGAEANLSFHDRERVNYNNDPKNTQLMTAQENGRIVATGFLESCRTLNDINHEKRFRVYKTEYDLDPAKAEADIISSYCKDAGARPYEFNDPAYEANVLKKYRPTGNLTKDKLACFEMFTEKMKDKWFEGGYVGDKAFAAATASNYGLEANKSTIELRTFQPKD